MKIDSCLQGLVIVLTCHTLVLLSGSPILFNMFATIQAESTLKGNKYIIKPHAKPDHQCGSGNDLSIIKCPRYCLTTEVYYLLFTKL